MTARQLAEEEGCKLRALDALQAGLGWDVALEILRGREESAPEICFCSCHDNRACENFISERESS